MSAAISPTLPARDLAEAFSNALADFEHSLRKAAPMVDLDQAGLPVAALIGDLRLPVPPHGQGPAHWLTTMPGLAHGAPEWWAGRLPGHQVHSLARLQGPAPLRPGPHMVAGLARDLAGQGLDLVMIVPDAGHACGTVKGLVCHPWRAWAALPDAPDLGQFCREVSEWIGQSGAEIWLRAEDGPSDARAHARWVIDTPGRAEPFPPLAEGRPIGIDSPDPDYLALCQRLGYDPALLPDAPWWPLPRNLSRSGPRQPEAPPDRAVRISWIMPLIAEIAPALHADVIRLRPRLDRARDAPSLPDGIERMLTDMPPGDRPLALLLMAAHVCRSRDPQHALGLVAEALDLIEGSHAPALRLLAARLQLELGRAQLCVETLVQPLLGWADLPAAQRNALATHVEGDRQNDSREHGHDLLIAALGAAPPLPGATRRLMVEIGTTREQVPGQGSTRKLALLARALDMDFVTIDMDPANSRRAARMFERLGLPFRAICAKGEDWLAATRDPIDCIFLDAYDFDHGQHAERRQARYETYLGARISDEACHRMHLDCAVALLERLAPDGLICLDDTWQDKDGQWTAKGQTAMPFLLDNGFEVIEARNHAVLLARSRSQP